MNNALLTDIISDLFENNYMSSQKLHRDNIIDTNGIIDIAKFSRSVRNDALEFVEMLESQNITLDSVLSEFQINSKIAAEIGIVYSIYYYCLGFGFFLPDMLKASAKNGLLKTYCDMFLSQYESIKPLRLV